MGKSCGCFEGFLKEHSPEEVKQMLVGFYENAIENLRAMHGYEDTAKIYENCLQAAKNISGEKDYSKNPEFMSAAYKYINETQCPHFNDSF